MAESWGKKTSKWTKITNEDEDKTVDITTPDGVDRLAVDALFSSNGGAIGVPQWCPANLRYEDMNASTGGVSRGTNIGSTYTDIYSVTGSGLLQGFLVTLEDFEDEWDIRLTVDSNVIFTLNTNDITSNNIYGLNRNEDGPFHLGFHIEDDTFRWQGPNNVPLKYETGITIDVRYLDGGNSKFRAGLVTRTI